MNQRLIEVVAYNPEWALAFEDEANHIHRVLADVELRIHHIGSTAIPNIYAKPIIDILLEVEDVALLDNMGSEFDELGYEQLGEFGIPGRRYFRKDNEQGVRTHHIHAFAFSSPEVVRHLAFRDYMIAHPTDAEAYSKLKQVLAKQFPTDIDGYMDGKDEFIKGCQAKALKWRG